MTALQKITRNTLVQMGGKGVGTILGVVTIALVTRYLGPEGFGMFTMVIAFLQVAGTLTDLGLNVMCVQMLAECGEDTERGRVLGAMLTVRFFSACILLGGAVALSFLFPYPALVKTGIALASVSFLAVVLHQIFAGFFQDQLRTHLTMISEVAGRVVLLLATLAAIWLQRGMLAMLVAVACGNVIQLIIIGCMARRSLHVRLVIDVKLWKRILWRSWPIGVSVALTLLYLRTDIVILSLFRPAQEVGWYGAAYRVIDVFTQIPFLFMGVALPVLARLWRRDVRAFRELVQRAFDMLTLIGVPLVVGTFFLAEPVMVLVAGREFAPSGTFLQILMLALFFVFLSALMSYTIVALDEQKRMVFGYALSAALTLTGYFVFIPAYGARAAAWLTVFSEALVAFYAFVVVMRRTQMRLRLARLARFCAASAAMAIVLVLFRGFGLWIPLSVASATYIVSLFLFKGISKSFFSDLLGNV